MKRMRFGWPLFVAALLPMPSTAHADGMRCSGRIVSTGDSLYDVRSVCGAPDASERRVELRTEREFVAGPCTQPGQVRCGRVVERTVEVVIDEWTYDRGSHRFIRYLTFEQGRLSRVDTGRYGND